MRGSAGLAVSAGRQTEGKALTLLQPALGCGVQVERRVVRLDTHLGRLSSLLDNTRHHLDSIARYSQVLPCILKKIKLGYSSLDQNLLAELSLFSSLKL